MQAIEKFIFDRLLGLVKGKKTILGFIGLVGCYAAGLYGIAIPDFIIKGFEALAGVGLYDKLRTAAVNAETLKKQLEDIYSQVKTEGAAIPETENK